METEQSHQTDDEPDGPGPVAKVGRINLIILAVYAAVTFLMVMLGNANSEFFDWVVMVGLAMMVHGLLNLVVGVLFFIGRKPGFGKGALLSGLLLLIIGFSSCTAGFSQTGFH